MAQFILLLTPPLTGFNTPYPATVKLKGFLDTRKISSSQADLGIEMMLALYSSEGFLKLFSEIDSIKPELTDNSRLIISNRDRYITTIDNVISFLQGRNPELAYRICQGDYLPEASQFNDLPYLQWAFGTMGIHDLAKHLSCLYLKDISDLVKDTIYPHFRLGGYAKKLCWSAGNFDELDWELKRKNSLIDNLLTGLLERKIEKYQPTLVGFSVPFPGTLYGALKCGQWIRNNHPGIKTVMGGGYPCTELRSITDPRVFDYVDFIILDDGEAPLELLVRHLDGEIGLSGMKRTFARVDG